ncbi:unnamed protein product [Caenorhabditis angaria]|uniref:Uncharacterized protein n=1 Tax=Caenorhabditis angaria TaxID=860376 RepID=A0A9P1MYN0_9PELO|nr:unnamed protein product [Caenorhabditis angaria]
MQELRTNINPVRSFDLPEEAPRARLISTDFLGIKREKKKVNVMVKDNGHGMAEFRRWRLAELTDREMLSSTEVKQSVKSPFGAEERNIGEFFPTRRILV